jgi:hypothetical protein
MYKASRKGYLLHGLLCAVPGDSRPSAAERLRELTGTLVADHRKVFLVTSMLQPRASTLILRVKERDGGAAVPDAYITWEVDRGRIANYSSTKSNESGFAFAVFSSEEPGVARVVARVAKAGYRPLELSTEIEVIKNVIPLEIVNEPPVGEIFVNGEAVGVGRATVSITETGIYYVEWGDVEGYVKPDPVKVYANVTFSSLPIHVEGVYRRLGEAPDRVKLTVHVLITYDDRSGIPNPLPNAKVELSDGQVEYADGSGRAVFWVKPHSGRLTVRAWHPDTWGVYHEIEVEMGDRDRTVNLDFGPFFGGEADSYLEPG